MKLTASFNQNTCVVKSMTGTILGEIEYEDRNHLATCVIRVSNRVLHIETSTLDSNVRKVTEAGNSLFTLQQNAWSGAIAIEPIDYKIESAQSHREGTKLCDADSNKLLNIITDESYAQKNKMDIEVNTDVAPVLVLLSLHQHIVGAQSKTINVTA